MKKLNLSAAIAAAMMTTLTASNAHAAGFQLNEHSANGLGRAFAGHAAMPENATVLAANAAAIGKLKGSQLAMAGTYIRPSVDVQGTQNISVQGTPVAQLDASERNVADSAFVPAMFYTQQINDAFTAGIGFFSNFGLATDYSGSYNALHYADRAEITTVTMNPTLAYQITPELILGLGVSAVFADAEIGTTTPMAVSGLTGGTIPGGATIAKVAGDDWGYGWNVGLLWDANENVTVGLSHRSQTRLTLEGEMQSDMVAAYNGTGSLDLDLGAISELAVDVKLNDRWSTQFSANFTEWSAFDVLEVNLDSGVDVLLKEENFSNTWRLSGGVTYQYNDNLVLRAGYAYDEGAVSVATRSLSIPDTDRHWITAGATYTLNETMTLDLGYAFLDAREADVNQTKQIGPISTHLVATQSATVHIVSAQLNIAI
ncbi:outer membrane protein transport protein [Aestuariibacter sp. AA17]|uniref:Outer membrane protein transport protein n=1 Tax=Fluctibacter corallii TaxID=2984329 RepID=A0ABT3A787_9ALTE|nr:outer membrane protein transport protein [Aestuariibacter sp. AA17]MCV2884509.1 outer membrane protein transport protein [Aestuariibacter sp. AA17]